MTVFGESGEEPPRRLDHLAQSQTLTAISRLVSIGGWLAILVLGAFFLPKLWDFGAGLQRQVPETAHALDRVTWRLQAKEARDERQDRLLEFYGRRFERLERRSTSPRLRRGDGRPLRMLPDGEREG